MAPTPVDSPVLRRQPARAKSLRLIGDGATRVRSLYFAEIAAFATLGPRKVARMRQRATTALIAHHPHLYPQPALADIDANSRAHYPRFAGRASAPVGNPT